MTNERFLELNQVWESQPIVYVIEAQGDAEAQEKAIERLTKQYESDTLLGSKKGAYFALEAEIQNCNNAMAVEFKSKAEYSAYIQMLAEKRPTAYDVFYQLGLLGSDVYDKLK